MLPDIEERLLEAFGYADRSPQDQSEFLGGAIRKLEGFLDLLAVSFRERGDVTSACLSVSESPGAMALLIEVQMDGESTERQSEVVDSVRNAAKALLGRDGVIDAVIRRGGGKAKAFYRR